MTEPAGPVTAEPPGPTPDTRARSAITRARGRSRRAWRNQLIVLAVLVLLLGLGIWTVWRHSEIRAVHMNTTTRSPSPLPVGLPPATLAAAWQTTDRTAIGTPVQEDVVVTYGERTVNGRDAATGNVRWSYTRSDRLICSVVAQDSTVIAIYAHGGLCDEVTGLNAGSGQRKWVRTLLSAGTEQTLKVSSRSGNVLLSTPASTELIEPTGGLDWWYEDQTAGCTTRSAVLGDSGVLQANACAKGDTLSLRPLGSAKERAWTVPSNNRSPLSADSLTTVLAADGLSLDVLNVKSGANLAPIALASAAESAPQPQATTVSSINEPIELVWVAGGVLALRPGSGALVWQGSSDGSPIVDGAGVLTTGSGVVNLLDLQTGATTTSYPVAESAGATAFPLGLGLVVSDGGGTSAYR
ncbi:MAG: hypothetical protein JWM76_4302 [Pseudonocardiales bacterium]|nr:hypothetical protein [Pseudonocardiales bacterium]